MVQDRKNWRAILNKVTDLLLHKIRGRIAVEIVSPSDSQSVGYLDSHSERKPSYTSAKMRHNNSLHREKTAHIYYNNFNIYMNR
jgi:hypothetical protein